MMISTRLTRWLACTGLAVGLIACAPGDDTARVSRTGAGSDPAALETGSGAESVAPEATREPAIDEARPVAPVGATTTTRTTDETMAAPSPEAARTVPAPGASPRRDGVESRAPEPSAFTPTPATRAAPVAAPAADSPSPAEPGRVAGSVSDPVVGGPFVADVAETPAHSTPGVGTAAEASGSAQSYAAPGPDDRRTPQVRERATGGRERDTSRSEASGSPAESAASRERRPLHEQNDPGTAFVEMAVEPRSADVGEAVTVRIRIRGGEDVGSVPFHLRFDPTVVRYEDGEEGAFLGKDGKQTAFLAAEATTGDRVVVGLSRLGRGEGITGGGELCVLRFTAVGSGDARFAFERAKVRDATNRIAPSRFDVGALEVR